MKEVLSQWVLNGIKFYAAFSVTQSVTKSVVCLFYMAFLMYFFNDIVTT